MAALLLTCSVAWGQTRAPTGVTVTVGSLTQTANYGAGDSVTLTFDLSQEASVQAAAPGQVVNLNVSAQCSDAANAANWFTANPAGSCVANTLTARVALTKGASAVSPVPSLSQWALIVLMGAIALLSVRRLRSTASNALRSVLLVGLAAGALNGASDSVAQGVVTNGLLSINTVLSGDQRTLTVLVTRNAECVQCPPGSIYVGNYCA
ncbi:IPTL-CTERM sorting domain-containing protein [Ottowia testudinis]|uniref:IPTL-CTERM sorting domain-containing protein n=1 Tax=Ottowia testudinis TaxID=2816950 RepID=A0A975CC76_9BURK|nr:IPTL-CTERM sorting domain-containing protein [Ottowia testudinis]QTD43778.1 IPTL-CTERM sorting domain-containing protein [Ottowia testudinis]